MPLLRSALRLFVPRAANLCSKAAPRYPTKVQAAGQARYYYEMGSEPLLVMAAHGDEGARRERCIREVMYVDGLDWPTAAERVESMAQLEIQTHVAQRLSRAVGYSSIFCGIGSIPLVFHLQSALKFNELCVTTDVPEGKDLETMLEVGQWTWNWMEPPLGTLSFVLLTFQFARGRGIISPFESSYLRRSRQRLLERYPHYSSLIIMQWAESLTPGQDYDQPDMY